MSASLHFEPASFFDSLAAVGVAFVFGALIGLERQYRQRSAGLRTMVLVQTGSHFLNTIHSEVLFLL